MIFKLIDTEAFLFIERPLVGLNTPLLKNIESNLRRTVKTPIELGETFSDKLNNAILRLNQLEEINQIQRELILRN
jgi:hypothetical protein